MAQIAHVEDESAMVKAVFVRDAPKDEPKLALVRETVGFVKELFVLWEPPVVGLRVVVAYGSRGEPQSHASGCCSDLFVEFRSDDHAPFTQVRDISLGQKEPREFVALTVSEFRGIGSVPKADMARSRLVHAQDMVVGPRSGGEVGHVDDPL